MKLEKVKTRKYYANEEMLQLEKMYNASKKMKMDEEDSLNQIIFIKYKEEENIEKTHCDERWRKNSWKERRIDMIDGVVEENIYDSSKNIEQTRMKKSPHWFFLYKEGRKKYMIGK